MFASTATSRLFARHNPVQGADERMADPYEASPHYARGVLCFICGTIGLFVISRCIEVVRTRRGLATSLFKSSVYRRGNAIGRYLSYKQQRICGIYFPILGTSLLLLTFFGFIMIWTFAVRPYYWSSWEVGSPPLAMRTGFMAIGSYPFLFITASKWSIVTLLTGHSYERLQIFHQFLGHMFFLLSMLHSFPYLVQGLSEYKVGYEPMKELEYSIYVTKLDYYWYGFAMLGLLVLLCWSSLSPIRNRFYETFKYTHYASSLTFLGLSFVHCHDRFDTSYWLSASVAVYALSVVYRLSRMVVSNTHSSRKASFELMPAGMVKLRIQCDSKERWGLGQHYFLRFASVKPLQSHPSIVVNRPSDQNNELVFLIRQTNGFTKALARHLEDKDVNATISVLIDGPFGGMNHNLALYEHVLLIGGGIGMSFIIPVLQDLLGKTKQTGYPCRSIQVLWSVQEEDSISWMIDELEKATQDIAHLVLSIRVYVTGIAAWKHDDDSEVSKVSAPETPLSYPWYGRADLEELVTVASASSRSLGIAACGPESLLYDVRNATANVQRQIVVGADREVFLHTQSYAL